MIIEEYTKSNIEIHKLNGELFIVNPSKFLCLSFEKPEKLLLFFSSELTDQGKSDIQTVLDNHIPYVLSDHKNDKNFEIDKKTLELIGNEIIDEDLSVQDLSQEKSDNIENHLLTGRTLKQNVYNSVDETSVNSVIDSR